MALLSMKEFYKDIKGFEGIYQVSNFGNVKSLERLCLKNNGYRQVKERILKPNISKFGYYRVGMMDNGVLKSFLIHRLVGQAFIYNPKNKCDINHIDGNKNNNFVYNLEWNTRKENILHSINLGLKKQAKGVQFKNRCILNENDVREIRLLEGTNFNRTNTAKKYNVSRATINDIIKRKHWRHVI